MERILLSMGRNQRQNAGNQWLELTELGGFMLCTRYHGSLAMTDFPDSFLIPVAASQEARISQDVFSFL